MKNLIQNIEAEIASSVKNQKAVHVELVKHNDQYRGLINKKLEGDFIISSSTLEAQAVQVEWKDGTIIVNGLSHESEKLSAFLTKDDTAILKAVKEKLNRDGLLLEPSFIVGPPGTGKTKVITKVIEEANKNDLRVLVLSPTHMAVENVFERINFDALGLNDGEVVLTIKTEQEDLNMLAPSAISTRMIQPLEDEAELLEEMRKDLIVQKRDIDTVVDSLSSQDSSNTILVKNLSNDKAGKVSTLKAYEKDLKSLENRINSLEGNSFLKGIAQLLSSKKIEEIQKEATSKRDEIEKLKKDIQLIDEKIESAKISKDEVENILSERVAEQKKINESKKEIIERLEIINQEIENFKSNNFFLDAKLVGSTLVSAATSQKIQIAEFDKIIVDEGSMALIPLIVGASQALNDKELVQVEYEDDSSLYAAQNEAVRMALNSKLVIVGDPRQLSPIAQTNEMKKSIFDLYGVDGIFEGETVKNTVFLDINFRNHPHIVELASKLFYGGLLKSGKDCNGRAALYTRRCKSQMIPLEGSFINNGTANLIVDQVRVALEKGRRSIGVITPYREQANRINRSFKELRLEYPDADIQAGTVHKFQGKEKDIVFFDLTYSPADEQSKLPKTYEGDSKSETARLLNVAMTRAADLFVLVGNVDSIKNISQENLVLKDWIHGIQSIA